MRSLRTCLARMRDASWSQVLFGDDPYLVLILLLVGGFVIYPLLRDVWPYILALLALAAGVHAWFWCREHDAESGPGAWPEDRGGPQ